MSLPVVVQGLHSCNGSKYLSHQVAALVEDLGLDEFAKPRQWHSNNDASADTRTATQSAASVATGISRVGVFDSL